MNRYQDKNRNQLIDMLRGFSILAVILTHINILIPIVKTHLDKWFPDSIFKIIFQSGYYGVMIFFVISGYLITHSILNRWEKLSHIHARDFYRMRFARIVPSLLGILLILSFFHLAGLKGFVITTTTLGNALFSALTLHMNWLEAKTGYPPGSWDVLWSLSVEEVFYLFFPLVCLFFRKEKMIQLFLLIFILIGPFARSYFYADNDIWSDHSYLSCMDGIAMGCLAALYKNRINNRLFLSRALLFSGIVFVIMIIFFRHFIFQLGLTKIGLNVTMLEMGIAFILINSSVNNHYFQGKYFFIFRWFGQNSYEIYLTHMIVLTFMAQFFYYLNIPLKMMLVYYFIILIGSGIIGHIVSMYFSEPLNQFLRSNFQAGNAKALNNGAVS